MAKSELQLQVLADNDWIRWGDFVKTSPQGTVFQTESYLKNFASIFQRKLLRISVTRGDELVGGLVLLPKRKGWISYSTVPYLIPYNGLMYSKNIWELSYLKRIKLVNKISAKILANLQRHYHFIEMNLSGSIPDVRNFIWEKWYFQPDYTIEVPLDNLSIKKLPHNQRRHINKFSQNESQFAETDDYAACYNLMRNSYEYHHRKPPVNKELFSKFCRALAEHSLLKSYAIQLEGRLASFLIVVEDYPVSYALFSGKDFALEENESELYLHWKILELYSQKNYQFFNLLGAMSPSISRVKLELGGRLRRDDHVLYFRNGFYRALYWLENARVNKGRQISVSGRTH